MGLAEAPKPLNIVVDQGPDSDRLKGVVECQRQDAIIPRGEVRVDIKRCIGISRESRIGDLHLGMMGVTVTRKDGKATMFPWRVVSWVEMDAPL